MRNLLRFEELLMPSLSLLLARPSFGYDLKYEDSFQNTRLSRIGR